MKVKKHRKRQAVQEKARNADLLARVNAAVDKILTSEQIEREAVRRAFGCRP